MQSKSNILYWSFSLVPKSHYEAFSFLTAPCKVHAHFSPSNFGSFASPPWSSSPPSAPGNTPFLILVWAHVRRCAVVSAEAGTRLQPDPQGLMQPRRLLITQRAGVREGVRLKHLYRTQQGGSAALNSCRLTQRSHSWTYAQRKREFKKTHALQCSQEHSSQQPGRGDNPPSFGRGMDKEDVVHIYGGILLSH